MEYLSIQDLDLSNATIVGFENCSVSVLGSDLVCSDVFGRTAVKFPFDVISRYMHVRGLPFFGPEEQSIEIVEGYSYISTMYFTLVIKNNLKD